MSPREYLTGGPLPRRLLRGSDQLQHLVGTHLLVGVTVLDETGAIAGRQQFHGTVTEVADGVVALSHSGGELLLPADPDAYQPARPGEYRLATGEVVVDPDHLGVWTITAVP